MDTPQHSGLGGPLDYLGPALPPGTLVRAPLGARQVCGIVWPEPASEPSPGPLSGPLSAAPSDSQPDPALDPASGRLPASRLKPVTEAWTALPPLPVAWLRLVAFAAQYYQRGLGEVALAALPPELRQLDGVQLQRRLVRLRKRLERVQPVQRAPSSDRTDPAGPADPQRDAEAAGAAAPGLPLPHWPDP
ncbi:MAG: hypothetical protein MK041_06825, partial [Aquabacterium sp.]|nr:hypothetical protein [Aquabacterium sp.]